MDALLREAGEEEALQSLGGLGQDAGQAVCADPPRCHARRRDFGEVVGG